MLRKKQREEEDGFVKMVNMFSKKVEGKDDIQVTIDCTVSHPSKYFYQRGFEDDTLLHFEIGDCNQKNLQWYKELSYQFTT